MAKGAACHDYHAIPGLPFPDFLGQRDKQALFFSLQFYFLLEKGVITRGKMNGMMLLQILCSKIANLYLRKTGQLFLQSCRRDKNCFRRQSRCIGSLCLVVICLDALPGQQDRTVYLGRVGNENYRIFMEIVHWARASLPFIIEEWQKELYAGKTLPAADFFTNSGDPIGWPVEAFRRCLDAV